jgi:methylglyoxal synthase
LREQIPCLFIKTLHGHQYFFSFVIIFLKPRYLSNMQTPIRKMSGTKRIALVAHDNKKSELIEWAVYNKTALARHKLFGTGTTGALVQESLGQTVTRFLSGPLGGDQQIGASIAEGKIDVLIFFWDPMEAQPHDPDIKALLRLAVAWNIPFACDRATADFLLTSPLMFEDYEVIVPDYSLYNNRLRNPNQSPK